MRDKKNYQKINILCMTKAPISFQILLISSLLLLLNFDILSLTMKLTSIIMSQKASVQAAAIAAAQVSAAQTATPATRNLVVNAKYSAVSAEREQHSQKLAGKVAVVTAATEG